jgi:anti-sigma factor RsiW
MTDYVKDWLGAYLDGELADDRRAWVEEHLASCSACRKELAELRALSSLLQEDAAPADWMAAAAFQSQVIRRLPGASAPLGKRALRLALRYTPLGLFGAWAFCQAVILISTCLLLGMQIFPQVGSLVSTPAPFTGGDGGGYAGAWLGGILTSLGLDKTMVVLAQSTWLGPLALLNLFLIGLIAVLFLAWLAAFWSYHRQPVGL